MIYFYIGASLFMQLTKTTLNPVTQAINYANKGAAVAQCLHNEMKTKTHETSIANRDELKQHWVEDMDN